MYRKHTEQFSVLFIQAPVQLNGSQTWHYHFMAMEYSVLSADWAFNEINKSRWPRGTLYPHMLALISPTIGVRSVGIVRSRTKATEFILIR
jgi:hypothetical protein